MRTLLRTSTLQVECLMQSYGTQHSGILSKQEFTALMRDKLSAIFSDCLPLQARTQLAALKGTLVRYSTSASIS
jgi:hypothetical protein